MTDDRYLASVVDYLKPEFIKDNNIKQTYTLVSEFYNEYSEIPTATEIKTRCDTDGLRQAVRNTVNYIKNLDKIFQVIIKCAIFEIMYRPKTSIKIIIKEYLNASNYFLDNSQTSYLNALLDKISKKIRNSNG